MKQALKEGETRIGWMENRNLEVGQYHCPSCETIFYFCADYDDGRPPRFCAVCGRKNLRAA